VGTKRGGIRFPPLCGSDSCGSESDLDVMIDSGVVNYILVSFDKAGMTR
jgi:hypothetical protein